MEKEEQLLSVDELIKELTIHYSLDELKLVSNYLEKYVSMTNSFISELKKGVGKEPTGLFPIKNLPRILFKKELIKKLKSISLKKWR